jgi:protein SCO1/2
LLALLLALAAPARAQSSGGAFTLEDGNGLTLTDRDFQGRYLLVFFGYTNCPEECPAVLYNMARALALLGATPARLQAVFITTDPARDTPNLTSRYAALFSPDIMGLSGTPDAIKQVTTEYQVFAGGPDAIAQGAMIYLLGPNGHFIETLPGDGAPAILAAKLGAAMAGSR